MRGTTGCHTKHRSSIQQQQRNAAPPPLCCACGAAAPRLHCTAACLRRGVRGDNCTPPSTRGAARNTPSTPPPAAVLEVQQPPRFHRAAGCLRRSVLGAVLGSREDVKRCIHRTVWGSLSMRIGEKRRGAAQCGIADTGALASLGLREAGGAGSLGMWDMSLF